MTLARARRSLASSVVVRRAPLAAILGAFAVAVGACGGSGSSGSQPTDKVTDTPYFVQVDFGPTGSLLPADGTSYCGPVSMADLLVWLARNGYPELAPPHGTQGENVNLVLGLAGLFGTTPIGGTGGFAGDAGIQQYMRLKGFGPDEFSYVVAGPSYAIPEPTWEFLEEQNEGLGVVQVNVIWYAQDSTPDATNSTGGHNVALLAVDQDAGTITISNPYPWTTPNPQAQPLSAIPASRSPTFAGFLQFDDLISGSPDLAILEYARALRVMRPPGEPARTFTITDTQSIDTNGAHLTVLAPIDGGGRIVKSGPGALELLATAAGSYAYTGGTVVQSGELVGHQLAGTPFGTGEVVLSAATLTVAPEAGDHSSLSIATAAQSNLRYGPGAALNLRPPLDGLTVQIGGYDDGETPNVFREANGTLVIVPGRSVSELGESVQVRVSGSERNLPEPTNGIVHPSIVAQDDDAQRSADFLGYGGTGFVRATYSPATTIRQAGASAVFDASGGARFQMVEGVESVYALRVVDGRVAGALDSTLQIGPGPSATSGIAGLILDGGVIETGSLAFWAAEAAIYTSDAGGAISAQITGSGGITTFGPGRLVLSSNAMYTGGTWVAGGTLEAAPALSGGSATGLGPVQVLAGATLTGNGRIAGDVALLSDSRRIGAGTIDGSVTVQEGAVLGGGGAISGAAQVSGTLDPVGESDFMSFASDVTLSGGGMLLWRLERLTDDGVPGVDWSYLEVSGTLDLGDGSALVLSFADGISPDRELEFWRSGHAWTIARSTQPIRSRRFGGLYTPPYADGYFEWNTVPASGGVYELVLTWVYAPAD